MKLMRMLFALAVAAPLGAQQPDSAKRPPVGPGMMGPGMMRGMMQGGMMGMPGMMGPMMGHMMQMTGMVGPMMRGMAFNPENLLSQKDALELTPTQIARLTVLRDAMKVAHDAARADAQTHMEGVSQAMKAAAPDTSQVRQRFQAMQAAMSRAHWAMLSAAAQGRALLTDAQRGRVEGWADVMQMHMGQMMQMMQERQGGPEHQEHHPNRD